MGQVTLSLASFAANQVTVTQDAVKYTYGSLHMPVTIQKKDFNQAIPNNLIEVRVKRFARLNPGANAKAAVINSNVTKLTSFCKDLGAGVAGNPNADLNKFVSEGTKNISLFWRSHFSQEQLADVGDILLAADYKLQCGMRIEFVSSNPNSPTKISGASGELVFGYSGTFGASTVFEPIYSTLPANPLMKDVPASDVAAFVRNADSLKLQYLALSVSEDPETCDYKILSTTTLKNGSQMIAQSVQASSSNALLNLSDVVLSQVKPSDGAHSYCQNVKVEFTPGSTRAQAKFSCDASDQLDKNAITCQFDAVFANAKDNKETVIKTFKLAKVNKTTEKWDHPSITLKYLPYSPQNKVGNGGIQFVNFQNSSQTDSIKRAFDLMLAVWPDAYFNLVVPKVVQIQFQGNSGTCANYAAAAYTQYGANSITWCYGGYMEDRYLGANTAFHLAENATTAIHEALHNDNRKHDEEVPSYAPCQGTAYSAYLFVSTMNCQQDYCYGLKNEIKKNYTRSINYSLTNDARRYQGQCAVWNGIMGVTP